VRPLEDTALPSHGKLETSATNQIHGVPKSRLHAWHACRRSCRQKRCTEGIAAYEIRFLRCWDGRHHSLLASSDSRHLTRNLIGITAGACERGEINERNEKDTVDWIIRTKLRQSYPCNRPWRPTGLWDVEAPTSCLQNRLTGGGEIASLTPSRPLSPGRFLVLISVRGWVEPGPIVWLEGLGKLKKKIQWPHRESIPRPSGLWRSASSNYARTLRSKPFKEKTNKYATNLFIYE
jgi:hypothetical protein